MPEPDPCRRGHPLEPVIPLLHDTLVSIADEAEHRMIVTDADGRVLWWAQPDTDRPHHRWSGAACPVHDPDSGDVVGAVDVAGPAPTFHPTTLALVVAAARLAEGHLRTQLVLNDERLLTRNLPRLSDLRGNPGALLTAGGRVLVAQPAGWLPSRVTLPGAGDRVLLGDLGDGLLEPLADGFLLRVLRSSATAPLPVLTLRFLGTATPTAGVVRLAPSHAELLVLLARHPDGLTTADAHGVDPDVAAALRSVLPPGILRTDPYRLHARVDADFLQVDLAQRLHRALPAHDPRRAALGVRMTITP